MSLVYLIGRKSLPLKRCTNLMLYQDLNSKIITFKLKYNSNNNYVYEIKNDYHFQSKCVKIIFFIISI